MVSEQWYFLTNDIFVRSGAIFSCFDGISSSIQTLSDLGYCS